MKTALAVTSAIPKSYLEALAEGWRVVHETTPLVHGEGRLLMCKDGVPESIAITYEPTARGYEYATPEVVTENVAAQADDAWTAHYREFGCMSCSTTEAPHAGHGMCFACLERVSGWVQELVKAAA